MANWFHAVSARVPGTVVRVAVTDNLQVWEWRALVEEGKMKDARKNCSILLFDRNYSTAARWDLTNAWPSKVSGPSFKSDSNEYAVEEITLVHEGMKRVKV